MAPSMTGADVAQLRQLADKFTKAASDIQLLSTRLTSSINATQAWTGGDAAKFKSTWNSQHRTLLHNSQTALTDGAKVLQKNADEQERASEGSGGSLNGGEGTEGGDEGKEGEEGEEGGWYETLEKDLLKPREILEGLTNLGRGGVLAKAATWSDEELIAKAISGSKWFDASKVLDNIGGVLGGENWGELAEGLGKGGEVLGKVGKVLGPVGVALGAFTTFKDFQKGDYVHGGLDGAATVLGAAALLTPPPADIICGAAAGAIVVGEAIYDHWDDITHVGSEAIHGIEDAGSSVVHGAEHLGSSVVHGVTDTAKKLWPF